KLTEDTNTYKGVVIKYNEPPDARKPTEHWRLYQFKGNECLPILHIHRQSGFLIGRDRKIADIPMDHPSISKQHAVLQYRFVRGLVRLYVIDLESANGTYLNNKRIEPRRYYELLQKDVIKFGYSSREYVVMTANLDEDEMGTPEEAA
ncbi:FHA domain protein, partial [Opisthorchis viverrini]